jgi:hypothetical protein
MDGRDIEEQSRGRRCELRFRPSGSVWGCCHCPAHWKYSKIGEFLGEPLNGQKKDRQ